MAKRKVTLTAGLVDIEGNPLANKPIYFYYRKSGETNWTEIGVQHTNEHGEASVSTELEDLTKYDFMARFPGDEAYEPSEATVENVFIKRVTELKLLVYVDGKLVAHS